MSKDFYEKLDAFRWGKIVDSIHKHLKSPVSVLDLGCGKINLNDYIPAASIKDYLGVDRSSPTIEWLKLHKSGSYLIENIEHEQSVIIEKTFDCILWAGISLLFCEKFLDPSQYFNHVIQKYLPYLREGGVIIFDALPYKKDIISNVARSLPLMLVESVVTEDRFIDTYKVISKKAT